jgi:hypothetical protein
MQPAFACIYCGGDPLEPNHKVRCDGRQGGTEPEAQPYTNQGKGLVLKNDSTTKKVAELFDERAYWTSQELNDRVGWQFSQAIYSLRRKGMAIVTLRIGPKAYAYQRIAS